MATLTVSPQLARYLDHIAGETPEEKVVALLENYLSGQLKECEREIGEYEVRYRTTFGEFAEAWSAGSIPKKRSHPVERDYMEWEGLEAEKRRLLDLLKRLPHNGDAEA